MVLYGHHDQSHRSCTNVHELARCNGIQTTGWKPLRHRMDNLAETLSQWIRKPNAKLTESQLAAYQSLVNVLKNEISQNPTTLVAALDAIFFAGLLQNRLRVSIADMKDDEGQTRFVDNFVPRTPIAVIKVHSFAGKNDNYYRNRPLERRLRIMSTLIHEMCHAFLLVYGCDGRECATKVAVATGRGFSGHGPAWQRVAREAQVIFVNRIVPLFPVEYDEDEPLGIAAGVDDEEEARSRLL